MALEITQQNFQQEVLDAKTTVLVDFWAPWCGPCRMQAPILEDFAKSAADVKVVKVNVDDNPELAQKYNITKASPACWYSKMALLLKLLLVSATKTV